MPKRTRLFPSILTLVIATAYLQRLVVSSSSSDLVTFTLFDNGSSRNGRDLVLSPSDFAGFAAAESNSDVPPSESFAVAMSQYVEVSKFLAPKPVIATRAYREDGELIGSFEQLRPGQPGGTEGGETKRRRVYLVAEGLEFVWPFIELGHKQTVSTNVVPRVNGDPVVVESLSETPRVFRVHNMASEEEATAVIETAVNAEGVNALKRSTVGSGKDENGNEVAREDAGRTSENAWDSSSPAAVALITRSFQLTNIEEDAGKRDGMQVVKYEPTQGYNTHPDYFSPRDDEDFDFNPYSGGSNRFATVFMYLNDPEEGGNTVFPGSPGINPVEPPQDVLNMFESNSWERNVVEKCYTSLGVTPKLGTAALFYSITPDGKVDPTSHHAACPLIKGQKWGANIWIWNRQRYGDIRTGIPRTVSMKNECEETVYISWEGKPSGSIAPGDSMPMNSFEHHRFRAAFGHHKGDRFADFTVQGQPDHQTWTIKPPRRRNVALEQAELEEKIRNATSMEGKDPNTRFVHVSNHEDTVVCVSWDGHKIMEVLPGHQAILNSFKGHAFAASYNDCDNQSFASFQISNEPIQQSWVLGYGSEL